MTDEWVSVAERVPEFPPGANRVEAIVAYDTVVGPKVVAATWERPVHNARQTEPRWTRQGFIFRFVVTHWMPLPAPPGGKGG